MDPSPPLGLEAPQFPNGTAVEKHGAQVLGPPAGGCPAAGTALQLFCSSFRLRSRPSLDHNCVPERPAARPAARHYAARLAARRPAAALASQDARGARPARRRRGRGAHGSLVGFGPSEADLPPRRLPRPLGPAAAARGCPQR